MHIQPKHIPNILTIVRMIFVPIIIVLILVPSKELYHFSFNNVDYHFDINYFLAGIFFVIACLTDTLDGYLARRNKWVSDFGKLWDPIADKVLINSILICLAVKDITLVWIPIIMIARDVIVDALRMSAANQNKVIAANIFGKLKTIFQMVALILMFFVFNHNSEGNPLNYYLLQNILMYVALLVSIMSGVIYFIKYSNSANI